MINRNKLIELYEKQEKTLLEICEELNVSYGKLHSLFEKFKIPRRHYYNKKWRERIGLRSREQKKYKISKNKLYELYIQKNKTTYEIAEIFNCSPQTISRRLKEYGIPIRNISEARIGRHRGKYSSNWKGGITPSTHMRLCNIKWKKIANKIRKRDNYTCQQCGKFPAYDVHHIIPYRLFHNDNENNLVTLCRNCHMQIERITNFIGKYK